MRTPRPPGPHGDTPRPHVVSSDSLELPHVVMSENDGRDHWVAQQVVKGLTTSLVEKAQNGEDCTHCSRTSGIN